MITQNDKQTILIIDGYHLLHQGYYGSVKRKKIATNREGVAINAIYTFIAKINSFINANIYRTILVTFDVNKEECWRKKIYPAYKAKRKETPQDLIPQMEIVREFLTCAGIKWYEKPTFEGDDIMGTICQLANKLGYNTHILSNDKDIYQLVNENTKVITKASKKEKTKYIDEKNVQVLLGCKPTQVADIKSLMGDSSDNLKGVPYLHYRTACELLKKYDNVENIIKNISQLPKRVGQQIELHKEQILMNKKLATILQNLKLGYINFNELRVNWKGYMYFLRKHKIFVYLKYAETKYQETQEIIKAKREKRYIRPQPELTKNTNELPMSCNSHADVKVASQSDHLLTK